MYNHKIKIEEIIKMYNHKIKIEKNIKMHNHKLLKCIIIN